MRCSPTSWCWRSATPSSSPRWAGLGQGEACGSGCLDVVCGTPVLPSAAPLVFWAPSEAHALSTCTPPAAVPRVLLPLRGPLLPQVTQDRGAHRHCGPDKRVRNRRGDDAGGWAGKRAGAWVGGWVEIHGCQHHCVHCWLTCIALFCRVPQARSHALVLPSTCLPAVPLLPTVREGQR